MPAPRLNRRPGKNRGEQLHERRSNTRFEYKQQTIHRATAHSARRCRVSNLIIGLLTNSGSTRCYFETPHHSWERGTNENTNGLIRQYLPKRVSMEQLTQRECTRIATKLNQRPRQRLGYRTPEECYVP